MRKSIGKNVRNNVRKSIKKTKRHLKKRPVRKTKLHSRKSSMKKIKRPRKNRRSSHKKNKKTKRRNKINKKLIQTGGARETIILPDECYAALKKDILGKDIVGQNADGETDKLAVPRTLQHFTTIHNRTPWGLASFKAGWNVDHCRACFATDDIVGLDRAVELRVDESPFQMLMVDETTSSVGDCDIVKETDFLNTSYYAGYKTTRRPICRFCRTALMINSLLISHFRQISVEGDEKYNFPTSEEAAATAESRLKARSEGEPIDEKFFDSPEGNYYIDGEPIGKFKIECVGEMPKPSLAFGFKNSPWVKINCGNEKNSPGITMGADAGENPVEFKQFAPSIFLPYIKRLGTYQILNIVARNEMDYGISEEDITEMQDTANIKEHLGEYTSEEGERLPDGYRRLENFELRRRFLRKLGILEYCKKITKMTPPQAEAEALVAVEGPVGVASPVQAEVPGPTEGVPGPSVVPGPTEVPGPSVVPGGETVLTDDDLRKKAESNIARGKNLIQYIKDLHPGTGGITDELNERASTIYRTAQAAKAAADREAAMRKRIDNSMAAKTAKEAAGLARRDQIAEGYILHDLVFQDDRLGVTFDGRDGYFYVSNDPLKHTGVKKEMILVHVKDKNEKITEIVYQPAKGKGKSKSKSKKGGKSKDTEPIYEVETVGGGVNRVTTSDIRVFFQTEVKKGERPITLRFKEKQRFYVDQEVGIDVGGGEYYGSITKVNFPTEGTGITVEASYQDGTPLRSPARDGRSLDQWSDIITPMSEGGV